jgi:hypothetical protein
VEWWSNGVGVKANFLREGETEISPRGREEHEGKNFLRVMVSEPFVFFVRFVVDGIIC